MNTKTNLFGSILFIFLMVSGNCLAQDIAKDTIVLTELHIEKHQKQKNIKTKKQKFRKDPWCLQQFDDNMELVTLVDKLPPGRIHSVAFFVNEILEPGYIPNEARFEIMLYDVKPDGMPGKRLNDETATFIVRIDDKGEFSISLYGLDVNSTGKFFIGVKRIDKGLKNTFGVNLQGICEPGEFTSYYRINNTAGWIKPGFGLGALKMDVKVAPAKTSR
ncbi:MAG: hypothetical protein EOO45_16665 [Flavobacterium sp.]|nr:MAG: hypothetical protein EOO45_16665 [Flavobacterium sp.]